MQCSAGLVFDSAGLPVCVVLWFLSSTLSTRVNLFFLLLFTGVLFSSLLCRCDFVPSFPVRQSCLSRNGIYLLVTDKAPVIPFVLHRNLYFLHAQPPSTLNDTPVVFPELRKVNYISNKLFPYSTRTVDRSDN